MNATDALDALLACIDQDCAQHASCSRADQTYEEAAAAASPFVEPVEHVEQTTLTHRRQRGAKVSAPKRPIVDVQSQYNIVRTTETITRYHSDASIINTSAHTDIGFDEIVPTTFGLNGFITGISFMESSLIKVVTSEMLQYPCIRAECNYGLVNSREFDGLVQAGEVSMRSYEKNERMRAKKKTQPGAKPRKVQGNGTCFNSSIMIWIHAREYGCVYKIRVFRTGRIGLPGTKPDMIYDVIDKIEKVLIPTIHKMICAESGASQCAREDMMLVSLEPIMKDYKWLYILRNRQILDLHTLDEIFGQYAREGSQNPRVCFHQHRDSTPKLALRVASAVSGETMRVSIFRSGKINILGAKCDMDFTKKVCDFIANIISTHPEIVVDSNDTSTD